MRGDKGEVDARDVLFTERAYRRPLLSRITEAAIYAFGAVSLLACGWLAVNFLLSRSPW